MRKPPEEEGRRWLAQAEEDLKHAGLIFGNGGYYLACFLCQQIAEKAVKAFLYSAGEEMVMGHSVTELCRWAGEFDPDFGELGKRISILDSYYVPTRYPNGLPDGIPATVYTKDAAAESLKLAELTVDLARKKLSSGSAGE